MNFYLSLGPLASFFSNRFSLRKVSFVGGVLLGLGFLLSSFADSLEYFFFSYSFLGGKSYKDSFFFQFNLLLFIVNSKILPPSGQKAIDIVLVFFYFLVWSLVFSTWDKCSICPILSSSELKSILFSDWETYIIILIKKKLGKGWGNEGEKK